MTDNNRIDLRIEIKLNSTVLKRNTAELMTNIDFDKSKIKEKKHSAITIYFSDKNESVWDIARKYNTTTDAIKAENEITENTIKENLMLLIPCI